MSNAKGRIWWRLIGTGLIVFLGLAFVCTIRFSVISGDKGSEAILAIAALAGALAWPGVTCMLIAFIALRFPIEFGGLLRRVKGLFGVDFEDEAKDERLRVPDVKGATESQSGPADGTHEHEIVEGDDTSETSSNHVTSDETRKYPVTDPKLAALISILADNGPHSYQWFRDHTELIEPNEWFESMIVKFPRIFAAVRIVKRDANGGRVRPGTDGIRLTKRF